VTNVTRSATFEEGRDFLVDAPDRRLRLTATSRMPFVRLAALAPADPSQVDERLVAVTYTHAADRWTGYVPPNAGALLPQTLDSLRRQQPITVCVLGDSISQGCDASGPRGVPPGQPPFASLVATGLTLRHGGPVRLHNLAVSGSSSEDGRWLSPDVAQHEPDLVVVAFGMNDACYEEAAQFASHITDSLRRVADACPRAEFVLVSPMRPTPECTWVAHERFSRYRQALVDMAGPGVAVADVTALWDSVLERKHPHELSGNGTNHPNDFGHRLYAQTILATMGSTG
jgi:lysophospholipase L1-like esterase